MIRLVSMLAFALPLVILGHPGSQVENDVRPAVLTRADGDTIELDVAGGIRRGPGSLRSTLRDCSDGYQFCVSDENGFAFSFFRKCYSHEPDDYSRLRFQPKTVMLLHNDLWLVFDASPNFMFHYRLNTGVVGIYVGKTDDYDFRTLIRQRKRFSDYSEGEYKITGSGQAAACKV